MSMKPLSILSKTKSCVPCSIAVTSLLALRLMHTDSRPPVYFSRLNVKFILQIEIYLT